MVAAAIALAAAAAAGCGGGAPASGPALQITTETVRLRRGDPLPATSAIFDGERVHLRAARGETLGIAAWRRGAGEVTVTLVFDADGTGGGAADVAVQGFAVGHDRVRRPSTRMYGPSGGAGWWPDRLDAAAAPRVDRVAFFDVAVAADAVPGARRGTLTVGDVAIPVELQIEPVTLAAVADAPRVWGYYDAREVARAAGVAAGSAAALDAERGYAALARAHGMVASPELTLDSVAARRDLVRGLPWVPVLLPDEPAARDAAVRAWPAALAGTGQVAFAIPIDEPRRLWQKLAVRVLAAEVRAAGGGPGRLLFAVTDEPSFVYGDLVDVYLSPFAVHLDGAREVAGVTPARWTYNGTPPYAGAMILDTDGAALRTWGWIAWRWRVGLWYAWDVMYWSDRHNHRRRGGTGLAPPTVPDRLDDDAVTFDDGEDHGDLDGVLLYPGPRASWRLKALRRGQQDRALLEQVEACAGRAVADAIAAPLVPRALADAGPPGQARPGAWPTDEQAWEAARGRLLDALLACDARSPR
ncbi:MAG: hypothetical protein H6709_04375 [Kofleriaceae bacterium]|nr:hypothetical protein [Kofleriaceae bacterium]MCB9571305.1 hypothetical protein [Kofleriaceae bacterium]